MRKMEMLVYVVVGFGLGYLGAAAWDWLRGK